MSRTGRPPKVKGGLNNVLYVRIDDILLKKIEIYVKCEMDKNPGRVISKADVVRELLTKILS